MKIIPYFLYYSVSLALGRMLVGVVYIATFQVVCGLFFNHQYMLTDEFMVSYHRSRQGKFMSVKLFFLTHQFKHVFWVLKRPVSLRRFF